MTDDRAALEAWAAEAVVAYQRRARPPGGPFARATSYPRWAATIFARKSREIGFTATVRLVVSVAAARVRTRS